MNKKIMSFVLAMVLSVGLGSSLFAAPQATSGQTNSGVTREAGKQVTAVSSLIDRITTVFHYEHGMIKNATGADGSVTLYDRGQFRMSLGLGLNGEYSVTNVAVYATDYKEIQNAGGLENWLKKWGVTDEQLQGGGQSAQKVEITEAEYNENKNDSHYTTEPVIDEDGNKTDKVKYYKTTDAKPAEKVKWLDSAMNHLAGGLNRSISINFGAADGASVTFNANGKAYETYAWDGELIATNTYFVDADGVNGVITKQAEMDLVQKDGQAVSTEDIEDYATNKDNYQKAWSKTVTKGGKVISCVNDANPNQELRRYDYNDDGTVSRVLDYVNGTVTFVSTTGQITLSALDGTNLNAISDAALSSLLSEVYSSYAKSVDEDGNATYTFDGVSEFVKKDENLQTKGFRLAAATVYNKNGTTNYDINIDDSGKVSTTAYIANKRVATGNGALSADYLREQANARYNYVLNGGKPSEVGSDVTQIYWYADQLKAIAAGGKENNAMLDRFITSMGWDIEGDKGRIDDNGRDISNRAEALDMINDALNFSSGNSSPAIALTYSNTGFSQEDIDKLAKDNGVSVSSLPAERYVSAATVYHHSAQAYSLSFADKDPSRSRASYIAMASIFTDEIMQQYGLNEFTTVGEAAKVLEQIATDIENEINSYVDKDGKDNGKFNYSNYEQIVSSISKKYFKDPNKMKMLINWKEETKDGGRQWNGVTEYIGQATHEVEVGKSTTVSKDTSNVNSSALKSLLSKAAQLVRKLSISLTTGTGESGVAAIQGAINAKLEETVDCQRTITETTMYKKVDPVVVGKPTVTEDGKLRYGPGSTVYLEDGTSYELQEGEEIFVDLADLDKETAAMLLASADGDTKIMTMGNVNPEAFKKGKFEMTADSDYSGGYAMGDDIAYIEGELAKGENSAISWISDNTKTNKEILKDGYGGDWKEGWQKLIEAAQALF
ncbi:MAG: hypothetical protein K5622_02920 [Endomicrobiaceae bacterium]|nr:hypothetical protein [Endomicrobiaceae bacterium]